MSPGDGIGVDVTRESVKVLDTIAACSGKRIETVELDSSAERYLEDGIALPSDALGRFRTEFDAILFGAVGDAVCRRIRALADNAC